MTNGQRINPGVSAVLSFIFSGLGQIYNGQIKKGLWIMFFSSLGLILILLGAILIAYHIFGQVFFTGELIMGLFLFLAGIMLIAIFGIYSIFDAYKVAGEK
jgi:TM2 domain-containing membrane protein YozV